MVRIALGIPDNILRSIECCGISDWNDSNHIHYSIYQCYNTDFQSEPFSHDPNNNWSNLLLWNCTDDI